MRPYFESFSPTNGRQIAVSVVSVASGLIATALALHIAFVIFDANPSNDIVDFVNDLATSLVLGFEDIFIPDSEKVAALLNYGIAAIAYLAIGQLIVRALQR